MIDATLVDVISGILGVPSQVAMAMPVAGDTNRRSTVNAVRIADASVPHPARPQPSPG
jgi:hypothetical protein